MGLFDKLSKQAKETFANAETTEELGQITQSKATDLIKELAGEGVQYSKKIPDNVVVFTSTSGAGASTLVANVASTLANGKQKLSVLVIDLNILMPSQNNFFAVVPELNSPDLVTFLLGRNQLGDSIINKGRIGLLFADNKELMDSINCELDLALVNFTEMLDQVKQLYDIVLIDCPMKIDNNLCNTAFYLCDHIYMVWDEGMSSISNTEKIRRNMAVSGIDSYTKMSIILNKRTNIHYTSYPLKKLNMQLVEILPFDPDIIDSSLRAQIFCEKGASKSENAQEFVRKIQSLSETILKNGGMVI